MVPTIGTIVHFTYPGDPDAVDPPEAFASLVIRVRPTGADPPLLVEEDNYAVTLLVFYVGGTYEVPDAPFSSGECGTVESCGRWTWPQQQQLELGQ